MRWGSLFAATFTLAGLLLVLGLPAGAPPAEAAGTTWYAYAKGGATSPTTCLHSTTTSQQCTLAQALSLAGAGDTVALATPGKAGHYVGNWTVDPAGTSPSAQLTIEPAAGVAHPILDGNNGKARGCGTAACSGPVLTIDPKVSVQIEGLIVANGNSTLLGSSSGSGGAIEVSSNATVTVSATTFSHDHAYGNGGAINNSGLNDTLTVSNSAFIGNTTGTTEGDSGGAIDNAFQALGDHLVVSGSTFSHNTAAGGGAICSAVLGGMGTATVSDSTFTDNTGIYGGGAIVSGTGGNSTLTVSDSTFVGNADKVRTQGTGGGGAINNGEGGTSQATLDVSGSTFVANVANYGGAISQGAGAATVSGSTFSANSAPYGGAIANGITAGGSLAVSASTFSANRAAGNGGAINNGEGTGPGILTVSDSTFWGNTAAGNEHVAGVDSTVTNGDGGAIDNADNGGTGTVVVSASTFSGNAAKHSGGTVANSGSVFVAGDILNGSCSKSASGAKWSDLGYNVAANSTCLNAGIADVSHGAAHLGPLARSGGPTRTMKPLASNPAVGVIPLNTAVTLNGNPVTLCPTTDQRGVPSAAGKACNAGAVQSAS
jgi:hypothetical protein